MNGPGDRGPLRAEAPAVPLPGARLRVLRAVGRHEPVTTTELSGVLGGHENTTRQHLEALARDGFISGEQNRGRMGRPSVSYSLTSTGLLQLAGRAASPEHNALVATLADHLVATTDDPAARAKEIGLAWGRRLASDVDATADLEDGEAQLLDVDTEDTSGGALVEAVELLDTLGFSPVVDEEQTRATLGDQPGADVLLRTCPLLDAARDRPEVVCTVHEGMVEGFLRARGADADVEVKPFAAQLGCRAVIRTT